MAEDTKIAEKKKPAVGEIVEKPADQQAPGAEPAQVRITLDDKDVAASYTNFCRVTGTPEEIIVDFALNPNPFSRQDQTVKVDKRLVMNQFTAKRLFAALQQTILRHEQNFGVIELNVQRRLSPTAPQKQ